MKKVFITDFSLAPVTIFLTLENKRKSKFRIIILSQNRRFFTQVEMFEHFFYSLWEINGKYDSKKFNFFIFLAPSSNFPPPNSSECFATGFFSPVTARKVSDDLLVLFYPLIFHFSLSLSIFSRLICWNFISRYSF